MKNTQNKKKVQRECEGCLDEMDLAYHFQERGYDTGFTWKEGHCFVFVLDKKGNEVVW